MNPVLSLPVIFFIISDIKTYNILTGMVIYIKYNKVKPPASKVPNAKIRNRKKAPSRAFTRPTACKMKLEIDFIIFILFLLFRINRAVQRKSEQERSARASNFPELVLCVPYAILVKNTNYWALLL